MQHPLVTSPIIPSTFATSIPGSFYFDLVFLKSSLAIVTNDNLEACGDIGEIGDITFSPFRYETVLN